MGRELLRNEEADAPEFRPIESRWNSGPGRAGTWSGSFRRGRVARKSFPPNGEQEDGDQHVARDPNGADLAETRHAGIARPGERTEARNRGGAAEQQRASDRPVRHCQIAVMPAERQLHEDAVIDAGPENQRQRHQVEQVP